MLCCQVFPAMCFPMSDIFDVLGVSHIDFMTLDIEGPELEVIQTIDLKRIRIDIFTSEIHGDWKRLNNTRKLMEKLGGYREVEQKGHDVIYERTDLN